MTELTRFAVAELAPLGSSDVFRTQAERRAELRRMRTIDTLLRVLMAVIYLAMRRAPADRVWAAYLSAFAEAGMVGACADWFAVVALLRRPLGLPIPHTAVLPENKRRIGAATGRFITTTFSFSAWPSHARHRSTLAVLGRDGARTSATREQRSCLAGRKSGAISPRLSTIGTPQRSSIASSCKSARTCNISASTARW